MAMEITEMVYEQGGPKKPATITPNRTPKAPAKEKGKLLSSMKKKYVNGVEVMDTELRKKDAEFGRAMEKAQFDKALKLAPSKIYGPKPTLKPPRAKM
jgi:hypothetical protein